MSAIQDDAPGRRFGWDPGDVEWLDEEAADEASSKRPKMTFALKHLPGHHAQSTHGRGWNGGQGRRRDEQGRFAQGGERPDGSTTRGPSPRVVAERASFDQWTKGDWDRMADQVASPERKAGRDDTLGEIFAKQGFDGKPEIGDVDSVVAAGGREIFRGFGGVESERYVKEFKTGDYFPGLGMYGNGTYTSTSRSEAQAYSMRQPVLRMALHPEARTIDFDQLRELMSEHMTNSMLSFPELPPEGQLTVRNQMVVGTDPGRFAALLGYDAITVPQSGSEFVIVLNRTALVVE